MGAIASGGVRVLNDDVARRHHLSETEIERVAAKEQQEHSISLLILLETFS